MELRRWVCGDAADIHHHQPSATTPCSHGWCAGVAARESNQLHTLLLPVFALWETHRLTGVSNITGASGSVSGAWYNTLGVCHPTSLNITELFLLFYEVFLVTKWKACFFLSLFLFLYIYLANSFYLVELILLAKYLVKFQEEQIPPTPGQQWPHCGPWLNSSFFKCSLMVTILYCLSDKVMGMERVSCNLCWLNGVDTFPYHILLVSCVFVSFLKRIGNVYILQKTKMKLKIYSCTT